MEEEEHLSEGVGRRLSVVAQGSFVCLPALCESSSAAARAVDVHGT